jgi:hypothetical protein
MFRALALGYWATTPRYRWGELAESWNCRNHRSRARTLASDVEWERGDKKVRQAILGKGLPPPKKTIRKELAADVARLCALARRLNN